MGDEHEDVFDGLPPDLYTRELEQSRLDELDRARETLLAAARGFAKRLHELNFLSLWDRSTRKNSLEPEEAIEGFAELVAESMDELQDTDAIKSATETAEGEA